MKLSKNKLAIALGAVLSVGVASQASADVYGLSHIDVTDLGISISAFGGAGIYTFSTGQEATLNGTTDASNGAANCNGNFSTSSTTCGAGTPVLSGAVQNAPGYSSGAVVRGDNDYTHFGQTGEYSNAEAAIISAVLVGDASTSASAISESNLQTGTSAQANTTVSSNTVLTLTFEVTSESSFFIEFDAAINVLAEVTGADYGNGLAQANSSLSVTLAQGGTTMFSWAPNGTESVTTCALGLTCTANEAAYSLQNSATSFGDPNGVSGSGHYSLEVTGLKTGTYTLALNTTTSTDLVRTPTPVPGTLLLLGTGLLAGARTLRRNKQ